MSMTRRSFMATTAMTLTALALTGTAALADTTLDLSTPWPDGNFHTTTVTDFAEAVSAATEGRVKITIHSGGSMGFKGPELMAALRDGLVPMADVPTFQQIGEEPLLGINTVPFLLSSFDDLTIMQKIAMPKYEEIAERNNIKFLYFVPWPTQYLHLKEPIESLDALKGQRIRAAEKGAADLANSLGASGVVMPWGEVVPALASGRLEGVLTSASSAVDGRFWEFMKVSYRTAHTLSVEAVAISLDAWNGIDAADQEAIMELAAEKQAEYWEVAAADDAKSTATLEENGMQVVDVPAEMMTEMRSRAAEFIEEFETRVPESEPLIKAFLAETGRS